MVSRLKRQNFWKSRHDEWMRARLEGFAPRLPRAAADDVTSAWLPWVAPDKPDLGVAEPDGGDWSTSFLCCNNASPASVNSWALRALRSRC